MSVLSSDVFSREGKNLGSNLAPSSCRLTTASGQGLETHGSINLDMRIGKTITQQEFVIADLGNCEGILGLDFLEQNCCYLDFSKGILVIRGKSVSLIRETSTLCARLRVEESVIIPP